MRATTSRGDFLIKLAGPAARDHKQFNCFIASLMAFAQGVATPQLRHFLCLASPSGPTASVFDFVPGNPCLESFEAFCADEQLQLLADIATALATLHGCTSAGFSEEIFRAQSLTLEQAVNQRLDYCLAQLSSDTQADRSQIRDARDRITELLERIAPVSTPVLIHGDMDLRNLIERQGRLVAIIDFEHAKFHDAAYDFVKLSFRLADQPLLWNKLLERYFTLRGELPMFEQRLSLFVGLEILSGLPYWRRIGEARMHRDYCARLSRWLAT